jgi:hypothetical protein
LWMPPPAPPKVNSFTAAPNNGYINYGIPPLWGGPSPTASQDAR